MSAQTKQDVRKFFRQLQVSFPASSYLSWNLALAPFLAKVTAQIPPNALIAGYQAMPTEAQLASIFTRHHRFCFPRSYADGTMDFFEVKDASDANEFVKGRYGLLEPGPNSRLVDRKEIDFCFVPMLAFDSFGYRMGQGKGYYDRFLEKYPGPAAGVAFSWQEAAGHLPIEPHDKPLKRIVTETGIRDFSV